MDEPINQPAPASQPTLSPGKKTPPGWVWVALIVILVAAVLYVTQKTAPSGSNETSEPASANHQNTPEVKDVPATVSFSFEPKSVPAGAIFGVDWKVATPEQTYATKTAVYWSVGSKASSSLAFDITTTPEMAGYKSSTSAYDEGLFALPGEFEDNIKLSSGDVGKVVYLRAYASVAGKNYWSKEMAVPIKAAGGGSGGS